LAVHTVSFEAGECSGLAGVIRFETVGWKDSFVGVQLYFTALVLRTDGGGWARFYGVRLLDSFPCLWFVQFARCEDPSRARLALRA
jgi:hypothetical protein